MIKIKPYWRINSYSLLFSVNIAFFTSYIYSAVFKNIETQGPLFNAKTYYCFFFICEIDDDLNSGSFTYYVYLKIGDSVWNNLPLLLHVHYTPFSCILHVYELYKQQYHINENYACKTSNIVKDIAFVHHNIRILFQDVVL